MADGNNDDFIFAVMKRVLVLIMATLTSGYILTNGHQSYDGADAELNNYFLQRTHVAPQNHYPIVNAENQDDDGDDENLYWHGNLPPIFALLYRNVEVYENE